MTSSKLEATDESSNKSKPDEQKVEEKKKITTIIVKREKSKSKDFADYKNICFRVRYNFF